MLTPTSKITYWLELEETFQQIMATVQRFDHTQPQVQNYKLGNTMLSYEIGENTVLKAYCVDHMT